MRPHLPRGRPWRGRPARPSCRPCASFPSGTANVVACRYLLDLSEAETAEVLGVAKGTVKSRLSRAFVRLREGLDGGEVEP
ncbi:MAG: sigma factor-like helix-turn-helix DNA-binding protein [Actinomycetota bacterium]